MAGDLVLSAVCAIALLASLLVLAVGMMVRVGQWLRTPQPLPVPATPAPTTRAGVVLRLVRETFLFHSLFKASRWTWVAGWCLHVALALVALGHLRFLTHELWRWLPDTHALAAPVGVLLLLSLAGLWLRRVLVKRVRYVSQPSDHLMLLLLASVAASGLWMAAADDGVAPAVRVFVRGLAAGELRPYPADAAAVVHLLLASVLFAVFPFSKLLHAPGLFASPTRYQPDSARLSGQPSVRGVRGP